MNTHCIGIVFVRAECQQELRRIPVGHLPTLKIPEVVVPQVGVLPVVHGLPVNRKVVGAPVNLHAHSTAFHHCQPHGKVGCRVRPQAQGDA